MSRRRTRALIALDPGADRERLQPALAIEPDIEVVGVADAADSWSTLQQVPADVLVVACGGDSDSTLALVASAVSQHPGRPVVVVYCGSPNGFVNRVFEAGADDIVAVDGSDGMSRAVLFSIEKAVARRRTNGAHGALGSLICVLGPKGGTGKTLTAVNTSIALAEMGQRTAVVDIDLQFGDLGLALGIRPEKTLIDLATSSGGIDAEKIEAFMLEHPSGVRALLAPTRPDQSGAVTTDLLREVYGQLRSNYDQIVVDTPPGFGPEVIACIDASSEVCMVTTLDSLSLKNLKLGLETLRLMGYDEDRVRIVLNRSDSRVGLAMDDATTVIGRKPDVFIPSSREVARSMNQGTPMAVANKRSDAARGFTRLAEAYAAARGGGMPETRNRRLFARS
jgi:pilus assembly protein CpaE